MAIIPSEAMCFLLRSLPSELGEAVSVEAAARRLGARSRRVLAKEGLRLESSRGSMTVPIGDGKPLSYALRQFMYRMRITGPFGESRWAWIPHEAAIDVRRASRSLGITLLFSSRKGSTDEEMAEPVRRR